MPKIPTQDEPGGVLLDTGSSVNTNAFTQEALSQKQAASSIASSLLGRARGASNTASNTKIQNLVREQQEKEREKRVKEEKIAREIARKKEIAQNSRELDKALDVKQFSSALLREAQDMAIKEGRPVDTAQLESKFNDYLSGQSEGLSPEAALKLKQRSMSTLDSLLSKSDSLNTQVEIGKLDRINQKADQDALSHIRRIDRPVTYEDLETSISERVKFYQAQGFGGEALQILQEETTQSYTAEYAETLLNNVKLGISPNTFHIQDGQLRISSLENYARFLNEEKNLSTEDRKNLYNKAAKVYSSMQDDFITNQKKLAEAEVDELAFNSGTMPIKSDIAKNKSNQRFASALNDLGIDANESTFDISANANQLGDAITKYYKETPNAPRPPEMVLQYLSNNIFSPDEATRIQTIGVFNKLMENEKFATQAATLLGADKIAAITATSLYGDTISPQDILTAKRDLKFNPNMQRRAIGVVNSISDIEAEIFPGILLGRAASLTGEGQSGILRDEYTERFQINYALLNEDEDAAKEATARQMKANYHIVQDTKDDFLDDNEIVVYMKGGQFGSDFQSIARTNIEKVLADNPHLGANLSPEFGVIDPVNLRDSNIRKEAAKSIKLLPIVKQGIRSQVDANGDAQPAAYFHLYTEDGGKLKDALGLPIEIAVPGKSGAQYKRDKVLRAALNNTTKSNLLGVVPLKD